MLTEIEQIKKLLREKKYILIALPKAAAGDELAAGLALKIFLEKLHKQVDAAAADFVAPKNLKFLPGAESVKPALANLQKFIIKVDVTRAPVDTISYDVKDGWLSVYLTPKTGTITKNELRTAQTTFKYDLIVTVGAADLNALGDLFLNNTDLFYRLPVINLDNHASNDHFGQVNLIDLNAAALAEIVFNLLTNLNASLLDENLATALLTGMIVKTKSFKSGRVTPQTLETASALMNLGANREQIIDRLYRTKTLPTLKLWGKVLAHLQHDRDLGLIWSTLTRDDFARALTADDDLSGLIDELLINSPQANLILLIYENSVSGDIKITLTAAKDYDALKLLSAFNPQGDKNSATASLTGKTLAETEIAVIEQIKNRLPS